MSSAVSVAAAAVLTLTLVAACRDPVSASSLVGRSYALAQVDGAPPPVRIDASPGDTTYLLGDSLTFLPDGKASRVLTYRLAFRTGTTMPTYHLDLEYRLAGARVEVGWFTPCPATALCSGNIVGTVAGESIVVGQTGAGAPASLWRYDRSGDVP